MLYIGTVGASADAGLRSDLRSHAPASVRLQSYSAESIPMVWGSFMVKDRAEK